MTEDQVIDEVKEILTANFNVPAEKVTRQATFRGTLGMDSLDIVDLVFFLQKTFGLTAELEDYRDLHTMEKLAAFILRRRPS